VETGNALAAELVLFVADNGAAAVPSDEVAYTAGFSTEKVVSRSLGI
jgi:hypothetical protein